MSVLVKNMAMPETCDECNFHCYEGNGNYSCVVTLSLANSNKIRLYISHFEKRTGHCRGFSWFPGKEQLPMIPEQG